MCYNFPSAWQFCRDSKFKLDYVDRYFSLQSKAVQKEWKSGGEKKSERKSWQGSNCLKKPFIKYLRIHRLVRSCLAKSVKNPDLKAILSGFFSERFFLQIRANLCKYVRACAFILNFWPITLGEERYRSISTFSIQDFYKDKPWFGRRVWEAAV